MTFDALVNAYAADLYRFGFWLCRNQAQAEDLVQETFMRAWKGLDGLKDSKALKAWLFTILRREHARCYSRPSLDLVSMDEMDYESQHFAAPGSDGAADMEFTQALDALPPDYREPLLLQALGGYSCDEIAGIMQIKTGAVMTRLFRARQKLRRSLESESLDMKRKEPLINSAVRGEPVEP